MSDDRTVKKVFLRRPVGRRKAGRPKWGWLDCIENDLKWKGSRDFGKKVENRSAWAVILKRHWLICKDRTLMNNNNKITFQTKMKVKKGLKVA